MQNTDNKLRLKTLILEFSSYSDTVICNASIPGIVKGPKGRLISESLAKVYGAVCVSQHLVYDIPDFIKEKGEYAEKTWRNQKRKACFSYIEQAWEEWQKVKAYWDMLLVNPELKPKEGNVWKQEEEISKMLYGWRAWCSRNY